MNTLMDSSLDVLLLGNVDVALEAKAAITKLSRNPFSRMKLEASKKVAISSQSLFTSRKRQRSIEKENVFKY